MSDGVNVTANVPIEVESNQPAIEIGRAMLEKSNGGV